MKRYILVFMESYLKGFHRQKRQWWKWMLQASHLFCLPSGLSIAIPSPYLMGFHLKFTFLFPLFFFIFFMPEAAKAQSSKEGEISYHFHTHSQKKEKRKNSILTLIQNVHQEPSRPLLINEELSLEFRDRHYQIFLKDMQASNKFFFRSYKRKKALL